MILCVCVCVCVCVCGCGGGGGGGGKFNISRLHHPSTQAILNDINALHGSTMTFYITFSDSYVCKTVSSTSNRVPQ